MSLFGDLDVAGAADNPYDIADGTYLMRITEAEAKPTKDETKNGLNLTWEVCDPDSEYFEKSVKEWKEIPTFSNPPTKKEKDALSYLKQRLATCGVPESRMNTLNADDLINVEANVTVNHNDKGYPQIQRVDPVSSSSATSAGATDDNPFA